MNNQLGNRLETIASLVPEKTAVLADVGTDHAYLPIALVRRKTAESAVASDVREGPLQRAEEHIRREGMENSIRTVLADGLAPLEKYSPDVCVIAGMGGDLISRIVSDASFTQSLQSPPLLILQPMTKSEVLRKYLSEAGYAILTENICAEDERIYEILSVRFRGEEQIKSFSDAELFCGEAALIGQNPRPVVSRYLDGKRSQITKKLRGFEQSAVGVPEELRRFSEEFERYAEQIERQYAYQNQKNSREDKYQ